MSAIDFADYFLHPTDTAHRRYEALRAVFAEDYSLNEVAQRFDLSYGTIRNGLANINERLEMERSPLFRFIDARKTCCV